MRVSKKVHTSPLCTFLNRENKKCFCKVCCSQAVQFCLSCFMLIGNRRQKIK
ncbi:unnamed protein product, partial [Brachionus calyciflorus]